MQYDAYSRKQLSIILAANMSFMESFKLKKTFKIMKSKIS